MNGIVCLLKPTGLTSSDAVVRVRKTLGTRAVGHLGTLDPFAAGVLPIAVGKATRLFDLFLRKTKSYRAFVRFGSDSATLDTDCDRVTDGGRIPSETEIRAILPRFCGEQFQTPPAYSAKSVGGVRAYRLARAGKTVDLPPRRIEVESLSLVRRLSETDFVLDAAVSSGTYIRTLFSDLAHALGTTAILSALIRTRCGAWTTDDCVTEDELAARGAEAIIPIGRVLADLPSVSVPPAYAAAFRNGVPIPAAGLPSEPFAVICDGELYGLGTSSDGMLRLKTYLRDRP